MRSKPFAIVFHLLPLAPLAMHWPYATIAAVILVAVPYIKVQKLSFMLADLTARQDGPNGTSEDKGRRAAALTKEKASLERAIRLWKALTLF